MNGQIVSYEKSKLFLFVPAQDEQSDFFEIKTVIVRDLATGEEKTLSADEVYCKQMLRWGWEIVSVNGFHYGSAKVIWSPEDLYVDAVNKTLRTVRLKIGVGHEPDFVVDFLMRAPQDSDIFYFKNNLIQVRVVQNERLRNLKIVTDLRVSTELFSKLFISCTDGGIAIFKEDGSQEIVPFSPELRQEFLNSIDRYWQLMIIEALFG